jgi:hypothetical protein
MVQKFVSLLALAILSVDCVVFLMSPKASYDAKFFAIPAVLLAQYAIQKLIKDEI